MPIKTRPSAKDCSPPRAGDYIGEYVPPVFNEDAYYEQADYTNRRRFKAYTRLVERVIRNNGGMLSFAGIHRALGKYANYHWTGMAVENSSHIIRFPMYPVDLFAWFSEVVRDEQKTQWNGMVINPPKKNPDLGLEGRILA